MVSSDQITATLEQPLCVVRKHDQEILYKNQAFAQLVQTLNNPKFDDICTLFLECKRYNNLAEMMASATSTSRTFVRLSRGKSNHVLH